MTMDAGRKLLGAGFTSAVSGAAAKIRLDVVVRDAIEQGVVDGPRLLAASPELTVTGGLGDGRQLHLDSQSFGVAVDGPDEVRKMARLCLREGVDTIKLNISGDVGTESALSDVAVMTDAEVAAGVEAAHTIGRRVAAHARASVAVKRAVRHGVDIIYHCDFADDGGARHAGKRQGPDLHRSRLLAGRQPARVDARRQHAGGTDPGRPAEGELRGELSRPCRDAQARHPRPGRRRLRLRGQPAGRQRARPRAVRAAFRLQPERGAAGGDAHRRRGDAAARRDRPGEARAISPTCCWSTAIRWPTSACCRTTSASPSS